MPDPTSAAGSFTWIWFALLSAVFAALTNIFAKVGVAGIPSNLATWVRIVVILAVTSLLVAARGEWANPLDLPRKTLLFLVLSGLATGASWLAYFRALQLAPASQVGPVDKLSVLLIMIAAVLFLGETLNWKQWLGGLLILAGVLLVAQKAPEQPASARALTPSRSASASSPDTDSSARRGCPAEPGGPGAG